MVFYRRDLVWNIYEIVLDLLIVIERKGLIYKYWLCLFWDKVCFGCCSGGLLWLIVEFGWSKGCFVKLLMEIFVGLLYGSDFIGVFWIKF